MKCIIAGSRDINDYNLLQSVFTSCPFNDMITSIVSGRARGVDTLGERLSDEVGLPKHLFPAKWKRPDGSVDRGAGIKRNHEMGDFADCLIALTNGSNGTRDMIQYMRKLKKPTFVGHIGLYDDNILSYFEYNIESIKLLKELTNGKSN